MPTRWPSRAHRIAIVCGAGSVAAWFFFGCVDLFHSTDFSAQNTGPIDFCSWSEATAKSNAMHGCALLAACQSPVGANAVGICLANATLAYDCMANPNRPSIGAGHAYWACLARARSCEEIASCISPSPSATPPSCTGPVFPFTECGAGSDVRVDCRSANAPLGESCVATSQSCVPKNSGEALCTGSEGIACARTACNGDGTHLNFCEDAGGGDSFDRGVDCSSFGAGKCVDGDAGPACLAVDGGACAPSAGIRCAGATAIGCGSGVEERVDCAALADGVTCNADLYAAPYDLAAGCRAETAACSSDTCSGSKLLACVRGAVITIDCTSLGLGACTEITTTDGIQGACGAP